MELDRIRSLLEKLAGQQVPFERPLPERTPDLFPDGVSGLGYSQLNELLLLYGLDRA